MMLPSFQPYDLRAQVSDSLLTCKTGTMTVHLHAMWGGQGHMLSAMYKGSRFMVLCFEGLEFDLNIWFQLLNSGKGAKGFRHPFPETTRLQTLQSTGGLGPGPLQCSPNLREEDGPKSQGLPSSTLQAPKDNLLAGREINLLFFNPSDTSLNKSPDL